MDTTEELPYQPSTRAPPPTGPVPLYARSVQRIFPYSLRPIVIYSSLISLIYLVVLGIADFRYATREGVSGKLKIFEIVQGILFIFAAGVEALGFFAAYSNRLPLARIYSFSSLVAFAAVVTSEVLGVIVNYTLKSDVINSCALTYTGSVGNSGYFFGNSSDDPPMTAAQAATYCESQWSSDRTWDFVWLFITFFVGFAFVCFSFAYVRQLLDPSSVRMRTNRRQQLRQNNAQQASGPYDPDAAFAYPPRSGASYQYPPPPGAPPPTGSGAPPGYAGRDSFDDDYDGDTKSPAAYGYGYNYGQDDNPFNRPGSSRNVAMHPDDVDEIPKRDSSETLRGEDTIKKVTSGHGHLNDEDDDHTTPRI